MGILRSDLLTHSQLQPTGSVFFDGTDDKITTTGFGNIGTSDFTLECLVYLSTTSGIQRIISADEGSQGTEYTAIRSNPNHGWQGYIGTDTGWWEGRSGNDHPSWVTGWHHVVLQRLGNDGYIFVDGKYVITGNDGSSASNAADPVTVTTFVLGHGIGSEYLNNGYISNARISMKAVYGGTDFTPPKLELKPLGETYLLCCQSSSSSSEAAVAPAAGLTVTGAAASSFTPDLKKDITDTGVVFDGFGSFATSTYMIPPGGNTRERNRGRAVFSGGYTGPSGSGQTGTTTMEFFNIQSGGRSIEFGTLSEQRKFSAALGSATRGVVGGSDGSPAWVTGTMEFVTIANESNTTTFGNMTAVGGMVSACSNNTRGIFFSVWDPSGSGPSHKGHIDYITIATAGNSADFGELSVNRPEAAGFSSPTRGICAGGYPAADGTTMSNVIDYITIATTGNASDFGDLTQARQAVSGASSQTRGVVAAGAVYASPSYTFNINTIDYVTIASTGNAADFGDLSAGATGKSVGNCSNQIRGVFGGGKSSTPTYINTVEFINIAATGNAFDFGDLTRTPAYGSVMCDSHGGLS